MPRARSIAALGAALLLAGFAFDSPSLIVPGVALLLLVAAAVAWVGAAARTLRVRRAPGPSTVVEGESYPLGVQILRGRVPLPGAELRDPALDAPLQLGSRPAPVVRADVTLERRGRRRLAPAAVIVADPLGLYSRRVESPEGAEVLVLPRIERVHGAGPGGAGGGRWRAGRGRIGDGGESGGREGAVPAAEMDGLRPHVDGVPASRIHWPTAARTGELVDRRLVPGSESSHVVVLDVSRFEDEDALDRAVRAAGSLCLHLAPEGGCLLHLPGEPRALAVAPRLDGWDRAHAALALVQPGDGPVSAGRSRRGLTVWVSSGTEAHGAAELRAAASRASHLVVPVELPGIQPVLAVAGCLGYALGARAALSGATGRAAA